MSVRVVPVEIMPVGELRVGEWCDHCALPSKLEQDWVVIDPKMHVTLERATTSQCQQCGHTMKRRRPAPR